MAPHPPAPSPRSTEEKGACIISGRRATKREVGDVTGRAQLLLSHTWRHLPIDTARHQPYKESMCERSPVRLSWFSLAASLVRIAGSTTIFGSCERSLNNNLAILSRLLDGFEIFDGNWFSLQLTLGKNQISNILQFGQCRNVLKA